LLEKEKVMSYQTINNPSQQFVLWDSVPNRSFNDADILWLASNPLFTEIVLDAIIGGGPTGSNSLPNYIGPNVSITATGYLNLGSTGIFTIYQGSDAPEPFLSIDSDTVAFPNAIVDLQFTGESIIVGHNAGSNMTMNTQNYNTIMGVNSFSYASGSPSDCTIFGSNSVQVVTPGFNSWITSFGSQNLGNAVGGGNTICAGLNMFGSQILSSYHGTGGDFMYSILIGYGIGYYITTESISSTVVVGSQSLQQLPAGTTDVTNCLFLGNNAGVDINNPQSSYLNSSAIGYGSLVSQNYSISLGTTGTPDSVPQGVQTRIGIGTNRPSASLDIVASNNTNDIGLPMLRVSDTGPNAILQISVSGAFLGTGSVPVSIGDSVPILVQTGGVQFLNNNLVGYVPSTLSSYQFITGYNMTFTGPSSITSHIDLVKIGRMCTLLVEGNTGPISVTGLGSIISTNQIPSAFFPYITSDNQIYNTIQLINNGTTNLGSGVLFSSGTIDMSLSPATPIFTGSFYGWNTWSITYIAAI
jgi:hypothetical protein